ncbi:MAG TPA: hypothetical protein VE957_14190 [Terriglobales bacterium]|nr:hypothetical protein [Terriglobales bacterium]
MRVHLVNPSDNSFGTAVITPRWLFVLAAATPQAAGDPILVDESLEQILPESIMPGDIVGISVHTGNALRGYKVGRMARERGAWVIYGGIHATLFPEEALVRGNAHAVVKGDGDVAWGKVVTDCLAGKPGRIYEGGRIEGSQFLAARWDLMQPDKYMWASVQTIRGCPKHCSFCSVWRTDGQQPRQRQYQSVIDEIVNLRRIGFRFIALADDNFYPVTLTDLRLAREQNNIAKLEELTAIVKGGVKLDHRGGVKVDQYSYVEEPGLSGRRASGAEACAACKAARLGRSGRRPPPRGVFAAVGRGRSADQELGCEPRLRLLCFRR